MSHAYFPAGPLGHHGHQDAHAQSGSSYFNKQDLLIAGACALFSDTKQKSRALLTPSFSLRLVNLLPSPSCRLEIPLSEQPPLLRDLLSRKWFAEGCTYPRMLTTHRHGKENTSTSISVHFCLMPFFP